MATLLASGDFGGAMDKVTRITFEAWKAQAGKMVPHIKGDNENYQPEDVIRIKNRVERPIPVMPVLNPASASAEMKKKSWFRLVEGEFTIVRRVAGKNRDGSPWYEVNTPQGHGFINSAALVADELERVQQ